MTATCTYTLGKFVWRELFTADVAGAKRFYGELFGWTAEDRPMGPDWSYTIFKLGDRQVGGMMDLAHLPADKAGVPPHWGVYVSVEDVDATAQKAVAAGGKVLSDCMDIPHVGRFAVVQDPTGACLNVFRSAHGDPEDERAPDFTFCWENLASTDPATAVAFYREVVGWETPTMANTTLFARQGVADGGVASVGQAEHSAWAPFVGVPDVAAYLGKVEALGGEVLLGRTPIPGVGAFAIVQDPAGAGFFLFERQN